MADGDEEMGFFEKRDERRRLENAYLQQRRDIRSFGRNLRRQLRSGSKSAAEFIARTGFDTSYATGNPNTVTERKRAAQTADDQIQKYGYTRTPKNSDQAAKFGGKDQGAKGAGGNQNAKGAGADQDPDDVKNVSDDTVANAEGSKKKSFIEIQKEQALKRKEALEYVNTFIDSPDADPEGYVTMATIMGGDEDSFYAAVERERAKRQEGSLKAEKAKEITSKLVNLAESENGATKAEVEDLVKQAEAIGGDAESLRKAASKEYNERQKQKEKASKEEQLEKYSPQQIEDKRREIAANNKAFGAEGTALNLSDEDIVGLLDRQADRIEREKRAVDFEEVIYGEEREAARLRDRQTVDDLVSEARASRLETEANQKRFAETEQAIQDKYENKLQEIRSSNVASDYLYKELSGQELSMMDSTISKIKKRQEIFNEPRGEYGIVVDKISQMYRAGSSDIPDKIRIHNPNISLAERVENISDFTGLDMKKASTDQAQSAMKSYEDSVKDILTKLSAPNQNKILSPEEFEKNITRYKRFLNGYVSGYGGGGPFSAIRAKDQERFINTMIETGIDLRHFAVEPKFKAKVNAAWETRQKNKNGAPADDTSPKKKPDPLSEDPLAITN